MEIPYLVQTSPLDDTFVNYLMSKRRETPDVDFKRTIDFSKAKFPEIAKDMFAMSNNGGGFILIGVGETETGSIEQVGVPEDYHIDQAELQEKFNSYCTEPVALGYREFHHRIDDELKKFAAIYIPPLGRILIPFRDGEVISGDMKKKVFSTGEIFIRRGTQSIRAPLDELKKIRERCENLGYQISLISGNPDKVDEVLATNLFEVKSIPAYIHSAELAVESIPFEVELEVPHVVWSGGVFSFMDISTSPLRPLIVEGSSVRMPTDQFVQDDDRRPVLIWLLNSTLAWIARSNGMHYDWKTKRIFYPLRYEEKHREELWEGLTRKSVRQVATMIYAPQLDEVVGLHGAATIRFVCIQDRFYLQLLPSYVITWDGRRVRRGPEEGAFITSVSHDDFNKAFLRNMSFFVSKLGLKSGPFIFESGDLEIDFEPMKVKLGFGIKSDVPVHDAITERGDVE